MGLSWIICILQESPTKKGRSPCLFTHISERNLRSLSPLNRFSRAFSCRLSSFWLFQPLLPECLSSPFRAFLRHPSFSCQCSRHCLCCRLSHSRPADQQPVRHRGHRPYWLRPAGWRCQTQPKTFSHPFFPLLPPCNCLRIGKTRRPAHSGH